ncbi:unknown [Clostridium sp. CAG:921]|nr:unknown [Clostridium sp. CAG:921]
MLFKGIIKKRLKKEKNFKIKNVLNILKGIFSNLIKKRKSDTEESTSNTSKQHDIEYYLEEIRKDYEGIDRRYAIISFGGIRISDLLHQTVSHGVLFIEQAEALNELIDMSLSGYAHTECTIALINFKNVFWKNIIKIAGLAEFFYNYRDYFEDQNFQDSLKKAAKILDELVSTNAQILTTVSDMYVSLNTSNSNDTEIIDFFTKRSKELLEVLNNKTS